jgi:hypothetical protein
MGFADRPSAPCRSATPDREPLSTIALVWRWPASAFAEGVLRDGMDAPFRQCPRRRIVAVVNERIYHATHVSVVGLDIAKSEAPARCMVELGLSGEPLVLRKFVMYRSRLVRYLPRNKTMV